jgi:hypothetical protein
LKNFQLMERHEPLPPWKSRCKVKTSNLIVYYGSP